MTSGIDQIIDRQIKRWELEAQMRRRAEKEKPGRVTMMRPWVTISRSFGSGGGEIARRLASNLGYQIFDREIVEVLIREGTFREAIVASLDEKDRSALELWVDGILRGKLVDKGDYLRDLVAVLSSIAMHGHAVILGRGANFVLDKNRGLHLRVVAPLSQRIETICRLRGLPYDEAEGLVHKTDEERAAFIRHHFHQDVDSPLAYDFILNTAGIGVEAAVNMIERALRQKLGHKAQVQF